MSRRNLPHEWDYRSANVENAAKAFMSRAQLSNHAIARARMSLIAGVDLALMKAANLVPPGKLTITKSGARVQDDRGRDVDKTCAAHALPCSIKLNGIMSYEVPALTNHLKLQEFLYEPYRYTNVVPAPVNDADFLAEGYQRADGLVANFVEFCSKAIYAATATGKINRSTLKSDFVALIQNSQDSLKTALSKAPPPPPPVFDLQKRYTAEDVYNENVRGALRAQLAALKDAGESLFSPILVEQVEDDFHKVHAEEFGQSK